MLEASPHTGGHRGPGGMGGGSPLCGKSAPPGYNSHRRVALVYLYKRGTFYPFAPLSGERRDNALELQVKGVLGEDLKIEPDLTKWMALWGAPGL